MIVDENVTREFSEKLEEKITLIETRERVDVENEWSYFENIIQKVAKEGCGLMYVKNERKRLME